MGNSNTKEADEEPPLSGVQVPVWSRCWVVEIIYGLFLYPAVGHSRLSQAA